MNHRVRIRRLGAGLFAWVVITATAASLVPAGPAQAQRPSSPFEWRGVVDGRYGFPTSHRDRLAILPWMGSLGLNVYVQANKSDLYQRYWWRDAYPASQMAEFLDEIAVARAAGVEWVPNLSPAIPLLSDTPVDAKPPSDDVCFACPEDLGVIFAKFDPFFDAGVRTFMLSTDDAVQVSSHPEDAVAYGAGDEAYGRMNRDLLNAVHRHYQARAGNDRFTLLTVLVDYSGTADTDYLAGVRSDGGLDPGIHVAWTGDATFSPTIDPAGAATYADLVGRDEVVLFDNYPVNDLAGGGFGVDPRDRSQWLDDTRLFLGPYEGRAPGLATSVSGVLANPMHQLWASRLPLATMAAYLADPIAYEPETAWRVAIAELGGGDAGLADAIAALAENSRSSTLDTSESPVFTAAARSLLADFDAGAFWPEAAAVFSDELRRERLSPGLIEAGFPELAQDVADFLVALGANAHAAEVATELLAAQRPELEIDVSKSGPRTVRLRGRALAPSAASVTRLLEALEAAFLQSLQDPHFMHGWRAGTDLNTAYVAENRLDAYVSEVKFRTAQWGTTAALATSGVTVRVNDAPVPLDASGGFTVELPAGVRVEVIATDGGGGSTGFVV